MPRSSTPTGGLSVAVESSDPRLEALVAAALASCPALLDHLAQPGHRDTAETRWASLALVHGDLDDAGERGRSGTMRRRGDVWHLEFDGAAAVVPHTKAWRTSPCSSRRAAAKCTCSTWWRPVTAPARPGTWSTGGRWARTGQRIAELEEDLDEARAHHDPERVARLAQEHAALLVEVRGATGIGGSPRQFGNHPAERARKAVAARVRDAIHRIAVVLPAMAEHLEQAVRTGGSCRYRTDEGVTWAIDRDPRRLVSTRDGLPR